MALYDFGDDGHLGFTETGKDLSDAFPSSEEMRLVANVEKWEPDCLRVSDRNGWGVRGEEGVCEAEGRKLTCVVGDVIGTDLCGEYLEEGPVRDRW